MDIAFSWNGKDYLVNKRALNLKYMVLPNKTVIKTSWLQEQYSFSRPVNDYVFAHSFLHLSVGEITEHLGKAILARDI